MKKLLAALILLALPATARDVPHVRVAQGELAGINDRGAASYLLSLYCSAAVLADDAIAVLQNVDVGNYHEYK